MNDQTFDVLIIGSGIAGLTASIKLAESGLKIGIFTKDKNAQEANTFYAQGGIIYPNKNDDLLLEDIARASSYTNNIEAAKLLLDNAKQVLDEILINKAKTNFDKNDDESLNLTQEAAHSKKRIIHKKDFTGREIQTSLLNYISNKKVFPNIEIFTDHMAIDLLTPTHHGTHLRQRYENNIIVGAYIFDQQKSVVKKIMAKKTILATGGFSSIYLHHSNSESLYGDGHAMAKRAGAFLTNMEFIQFHPTTFFDRSKNKRFLITEAIRGEGGLLLNSKSERFMSKYHPDMELAPRDVVARAILEETVSSRHDCVYLDISHKDESWIRKRFPTIYEHCLNNNVDITKMSIPVVPAAHYTCGGVKVDLKGKTSLKNLYAMGEIACNGLHGANRLASTSLLEGLTFSYLGAENIIEEIGKEELYNGSKIRDWMYTGKYEIDMTLLNQDWTTLKQTMWNYVGPSRSTDRLNRAEAILRELYSQISNFYKNIILNSELIGLKNSVEVGLAVIHSSKINKNSIGCFYRQD